MQCFNFDYSGNSLILPVFSRFTLSYYLKFLFSDHGFYSVFWVFLRILALSKDKFK